jgi:hypothetical protein
LAVAAFGALLVVTALSSVVALWPDPYARHFSSPLPATAKLLHYERSTSGFEVKYAFVFQTSDDQLLSQVVQEWSLTPATTPAGDPVSFVALRPPSWWLNQQSLRSLPEQYGWTDQVKQRYRSVWVDRASGKVFAEYGRW